MFPGRIEVLKSFPTLAEWKQISFVKTTGLFGIGSDHREKDRALMRIDTLVDAYNRIRNSGTAGEKQYLLGVLLNAILFWIDQATFDKRMDARRMPAVITLQLTVRKELASAFLCSINDVDDKLKTNFGKGMSSHGKKIDSTQMAGYLVAAKREQWRVVFKGGKAYKIADKPSKDGLELLDTKLYHLAMKEAEDGDRAGCGYALSMNSVLYVAPLLRRNFRVPALELLRDKGVSTNKWHNAVTYHSSFMGGVPVQCAGMIRVEAGKVTKLSTASGHYQPSNTDLVRMLEFLKTAGVDLGTVEVQGYDMNDPWVWADTWMRQYGREV